jgi:hypothetical protein
MRRWRGIRALAVGAILAMGTILAVATPAVAGMASIVTVAPVAEDASEEGVRAAAVSALGRAVRGARAMGMDDVMLKSIRVVPGTGVVVEIVASESAGDPDQGPGAPEEEAEPGRLAL